jgi:hypothetical protein
MVRKFALLASLCAMGLLGIAASSASAASYLHNGTTTGNVMAAGTAISPTSSNTAVLSIPGLGSVSCTSNSFSGTVGASGGASITGSLSSLTFNTCTDTIPLITITNCNAVSPFPSISGVATGSTGGTLTLTNTYVRCNVSGGTSGCYYLASTAAGTYTNTGGTLAYNNVSVSHTVPAGGTGDLGSLCGTSNGTFSVTYSGVKNTATSAAAILNTTP